MFVAALLAAALPYANLSWRSIGPAVSGGRVAAVAGTPQNDMLYYLGTAGGGVWKSDNGGATWQPVFDKQNVAAIGAVAIDPSNQTTVWVGTGEANPRNDVSFGVGLFKSTDGGKTWANVGLAGTRHIARIAVDPKNSQHVVVAALGDVFADSTDRGVYVTFDGGKSWNKSLYVGPSSGACDLAMDPKDPNVIYAGIWQFRRQPWTFTSGGPDDGLYKSTNGGKTWTRLTGHGLPEGITGRIGLAIAPGDPRRVYALIEAKGGILWRSDDAGATWAMVSNDTLADQRPFYFTHIAVDPSNRDHVYAVSEMLSESKDGGKKFEEIAQGVHVDYHAIWIAPNDPKRIIVGEDGGYALTNDQKNWTFSRNLAIGQFYHIGLSNDNPYLICGGLQDNNGFCGPSNSLDREGIQDSSWINVIGGDGMWAVPDPADSNLIVTDLQDGRVSVFNRTTQTGRSIPPYYDFSRNDFNLANRKYRFNWDSPIAIAPWSADTIWYGGNVVFQSTDLGEHWAPISPDLTLDMKEHQKPAGGPLALDVSGAEYSDTILYIEGSALNKGEIWAGTDDGLVQLTRDGGTTWKNVTPPGVPPYGRVEATVPSPLRAGTAYATIDRHRSGDYAPYAFVTHDYGATWTNISAGLPAGQYVRTIRADTVNPDLVYAGTELGLYLSYDSGAHWQSLQLNLPPVSMRDVRIQTTFDDLVLATHGRAIWILDDAMSLQELPKAQAAGVYLFPLRTAYAYHVHSNDEGAYTRFSGENPPLGAIVDFYQQNPQSSSAVITVLDASGNVVRTISGTHKDKDKKDVPNVPNKAGVNRYVWDLRESGPVQWMGAAKEDYRGPKEGATVVPGTYGVRIVLGGKTMQANVVVKPDPRDHWTQADYVAGYNFSKKYLGDYSNIDTALNNLDAIGKSLDAASAAAAKAGNNALVASVSQAVSSRKAIFALFTADYHNDEDSIQRPGALREDVPGAGFEFRSNAPPTASALEYAARFDADYAATFAKYNAFVDSLAPLSEQLKAAGLKPIDGAKHVTP